MQNKKSRTLDKYDIFECAGFLLESVANYDDKVAKARKPPMLSANLANANLPMVV